MATLLLRLLAPFLALPLACAPPDEDRWPSDSGGGETGSLFAPDDAAEDPVAIVDVHGHVLPASPEENDAYVDDLVAAMDAAGVAQIALGLHARHLDYRPPTYSADHDATVLAQYARHPTRVVPLLAGFDPEDEGAVDYVREALQTGPWRGIGELDLRNSPKETATPFDHPTAMAVYALAAEFGVPVILHFEPCLAGPDLEAALGGNPDTTFVLTHVCATAVLDRFENVRCEHEAFEGPPPPGYAGRIALGTDIQRPDLQVVRPELGVSRAYVDVVSTLREDVAASYPDDQERVANGNARDLLGLECAGSDPARLPLRAAGPPGEAADPAPSDPARDRPDR